jgi:hypothetical protein
MISFEGGRRRRRRGKRRRKGPPKQKDAPNEPRGGACARNSDLKFSMS